jgi:glycerol-3-phosphate dehydrogenase
MSRQQRIAEIADSSSWDMIIIGGGITGAGILKLASQLGLKVLLLEQKDFAWGSSSRSSKMVHGGLRYMAQGQLQLTRESVTERQRLLTEGYPLVCKQSFVMSHYQNHFPGPRVFNQLLSFYDFIAGEKQHKFWPQVPFSSLLPNAKQEKLLGGTQFFDALTEDARLVQRLIQESLQLNGQALNYAKVIDINSHLDDHEGAEHTSTKDAVDAYRKISVQVTGHAQPITLSAKLVVNASGAWAEQFQKSNTLKQKIRPLRGSHIVLPSWRLPVASVTTIRHIDDKRPVQIYPWQNVTIVGTTDVEHKEDINLEAKISQQELDYLLKTVVQQFPDANITPDDIISTFSGIRPVVSSDGSLAPSKEKREHSIEQNQGLITVTGGKLTTFRLIAEQVLLLACETLTIDRDELALTCQQPILAQSSADVEQINSSVEMSAETRQQIQACYGEFATVFMQNSQEIYLNTIRYSRHLWAELMWSVQYEQVYHLDDLMLRRTRIGNVLPEGGATLLLKIKALCAPYLDWTEQKWQAEIDRYLDIWQGHYSLPTQRENN